MCARIVALCTSSFLSLLHFATFFFSSYHFFHSFDDNADKHARYIRVYVAILNWTMESSIQHSWVKISLNLMKCIYIYDFSAISSMKQGSIEKIMTEKMANLLISFLSSPLLFHSLRHRHPTLSALLVFFLVRWTKRFNDCWLCVVRQLVLLFSVGVVVAGTMPLRCGRAS